MLIECGMHMYVLANIQIELGIARRKNNEKYTYREVQTSNFRDIHKKNSVAILTKIS